MIIVRLLSPEPVGWVQHHQLYSGLGADTVMESISHVLLKGMSRDIFGPFAGGGGRFTRHPAPFHVSGALRLDPFLVCRSESGGRRWFSISLWFHCCTVGGAPLEFPET